MIRFENTKLVLDLGCINKLFVFITFKIIRRVSAKLEVIPFISDRFNGYCLRNYYQIGFNRLTYVYELETENQKDMILSRIKINVTELPTE
jgi:hypothetical protein